MDVSSPYCTVFKSTIMKTLLVALFLVAAQATFAQSVCDSIIWKESRKLTWDDYKAAPLESTMAAARTNYNFLHRWHMEQGVLVGKVICIFSPCKSWSKNKGSLTLLRHEQGHFDIAEYFRRVYNKRILEETYTPESLRLVMLKAYVDIQLECLRMEDQYDNETEHSLNREKQEEWIKKIQEMLDSMKKYDKEEVRVRLG